MGLGKGRWKEGSAFVGRLFMRRLKQAMVFLLVAAIAYAILRLLTPPV